MLIQGQITLQARLTLLWWHKSLKRVFLNSKPSRIEIGPIRLCLFLPKIHLILLHLLYMWSSKECIGYGTVIRVCEFLIKMKPPFDFGVASSINFESKQAKIGLSVQLEIMLPYSSLIDYILPMDSCHFSSAHRAYWLQICTKNTFATKGNINSIM